MTNFPPAPPDRQERLAELSADIFELIHARRIDDVEFRGDEVAVVLVRLLAVFLTTAVIDGVATKEKVLADVSALLDRELQQCIEFTRDGKTPSGSEEAKT